jgi:WD40 repeat protein
VCGGLHGGSIRVWNRATLEVEVEQTLTGHTDEIWALMSFEAWLISASRDHGIRVWELEMGRCEGTLEGHTGKVLSLAVSGNRLVSGSLDKMVNGQGVEDGGGGFNLAVRAHTRAQRSSHLRGSVTRQDDQRVG